MSALRVIMSKVHGHQSGNLWRVFNYDTAEKIADFFAPIDCTTPEQAFVIWRDDVQPNCFPDIFQEQ